MRGTVIPALNYRIGKIMKLKLGVAVTGVAVFLTLGTNQKANADTLLGDTVTIGVTANGLALPTNTDVVVLGPDGNSAGLIVDFNAGTLGDEFTITSPFNVCGITCGGVDEWVLSDLNFLNGESLIGFNIIQSFSDVHVTSLTATSVSFSYTDRPIHAGTFFEGQFVTAPVPGPVVGAGLPGLVMAIGGFLGLRRRRKVAA